MRSAPPVVFTVGRFAGGARVSLGLAVFSALPALPLWPDGADGVVSAWIWPTVWVLVALLSWRLWGREALPPGELRWDSEAWTYQDQDGSALPVHVTVLLDLGQAMLLEVKGLQGTGSGARCTWLTEKQSEKQRPGLWHACRCAVFGRDIL